MDLEGWESFGQKEEHQSGGRNETDQEVVGAGRERRRKPVKEELETKAEHRYIWVCACVWCAWCACCVYVCVVYVACESRTLPLPAERPWEQQRSVAVSTVVPSPTEGAGILGPWADARTGAAGKVR